MPQADGEITTPTDKARVKAIATVIRDEFAMMQDPDEKHWEQWKREAQDIIAADPLTLEYEHLLVERKNMLNEADEHAQLKADVVQLLKKHKALFTTLKAHNREGYLQSACGVAMGEIDALLDRLNGGVT